MSTVNSLINYTDIEGRELQARATRVSPTSIRVDWVPPTSPKVYNGAIVLASPVEINPSNFPTNGQRYTASANFGLPADVIGLAHVVGAFYDDVLTSSITVSGLDTDVAYYFSVHLVTNVYGYYAEGARTYDDDPSSVAWAGNVEESYSPPDNPRTGQVYFDPSQNMMFVWSGKAWLPSSAHTVITGPVDPDLSNADAVAALPIGYPRNGDFFYNTTSRSLKTWDGGRFIDAESKTGLPTYERLNIGTTGEPFARAQIKNILKHQLGYPVVCVELKEEHFEIALNNALQEIRRRTDSAYYKRFMFMTIMQGQDTYYLNDPTKQTNAIVDIIKIHRLNMLGLTNFGPDNIYAQQFLNQFYAPGVGYDLVAIHLVHALSETYNQLFAGDIAFGWRESSRELKIYRRFGHNEKVLLECSMERPEQELLVDRWTQQWIQQWAEAELMFMLAHIRGKYATLPGPGGGMQLNADTLMTEGQRLQEDCLRQIKDYEVGQNGPENFYPPFVMG